MSLEGWKKRNKELKKALLISGLATLTFIIVAVVSGLVGKLVLCNDDACYNLSITFSVLSGAATVFFITDFMDYIKWRRMTKEIYKEKENK